jgi:hypothetical protein
MTQSDARLALMDIANKLDEYSRTYGLISTDFDREQFAKMAASIRAQSREEVALADYLTRRGIDNESAGSFGPCVIITPEKRNAIVRILKSQIRTSSPADDIEPSVINAEQVADAILALPSSDGLREVADPSPTAQTCNHDGVNTENLKDHKR